MVLFASLFFQVEVSSAQAVCAAGANTTACVVPQGATIPGTVSTNTVGASITNHGTVNGDLTTVLANSPVLNTGTVNGSVSTNQSSFTNSGIVTGNFTGANFNFATVTNSGFIGGFVFLLGSNATLDLQGGSVIAGAINYLGAGQRRLNVGPGLNLDLNIPATVINTNGAPLVVSGGRVLVIDPTGFALPGILTFDMTGSILNVIDQGGSFGSFGMATHGGPKSVTDGGQYHAGQYDIGSGWRAFASGFGGLGEEDLGGGGAFTEMESRFGGAMAGVETGSIDHGLIGFFAGGAVADAQTQFNTYDMRIDSVFGGTYFKQDYGSHRIHLAFAAGTAAHDQERRVANNNVAGGVEIGHADYDGWFVTPSATVAVPVGGFIASARASYTGLFLDGYTETGIANPMAVSSRGLHQLGVRSQIALPIETTNSAGWRNVTEIRAGAEGRFDIGSDNAGVTLAGTALSFGADGGDRVTGFAGATVSAISPDERQMLSFAIEGQTDFDGTYSLTGSARAAARF